MNEKKEKKPKVRDLTGGAYQPSEQFKELHDGTMLRLEDPTTPKTQEELDKEAEDRIDKPKSKEVLVLQPRGKGMTTSLEEDDKKAQTESDEEKQGE